MNSLHWFTWLSVIIAMSEYFISGEATDISRTWCIISVVFHCAAEIIDEIREMGAH